MTATITYTSARRYKPDVYSGAEMADLTYTNWTAGNSATLSNDTDGNLKVAYNAVAAPYVYRNFTVVSGACYRVVMTTAEDGTAQRPYLSVGTSAASNNLADYDLRKTTATDVDGTLDVYVYTSGTTLSLAMRVDIGSTGYALLGSVSVKRVTTMSHALNSVLTDDLSVGVSQFTNVNSGIAGQSVFGHTYGREDNSIELTSTAANGRANRNLAFPAVSGRQYKFSCLALPHNATKMAAYIGSSSAGSELGTYELSYDLDATYPFFTAGSGLRWDFTNDNGSWAATNGTITPAATYSRIAATSTNCYIARSSLSFSGYQYRYVAMRVRRHTSTWSEDVHLYYSTSYHSYSASYVASRGTDALGTVDEWVILVWDMWQLTAGGTDWKDNTITGLQVYNSVANAGEWDVDWIAVGNLNPLEVTFTATQSYAYLSLINPDGGSGTIAYYILPHADQLDSEYTLSPGISRADQSYPESINRQISLNGTTETIFSREDEIWSVTTDILTSNDELADYLEFTSSCKAGETFTIDLYGDGNEVTAKLEPNSVSIDRVSGYKYRVSFAYRVVA